MVKILSMFNNKGGVGKSTLTFHLAHALAEQGHRVLMVDCDPQCNLTIYCMPVDEIHAMWEAEDPFIGEAGFEHARSAMAPNTFEALNGSNRSLHYILKPTEDGTADLPSLPPPVEVADGLDLVPGRLTLHLYEGTIASRWNGAYAREPLAIKTVTRLRTIIEQYAELNGYDYAIVDTSPSLGALNKVAISTVDAFIVPCLPDMFSLYGIRNIGRALAEWEREFATIKTLISEEQRKYFPDEYVRFAGFTIYNAKKYSNPETMNLARAHYDYATQIPSTIMEHIPESVRSTLPNELLSAQIGEQSVMFTHNTYPSSAQKYRTPIWLVPDAELDPEDVPTVSGNRTRYTDTQEAYHSFATAVVDRLAAMNADPTPDPPPTA